MPVFSISALLSTVAEKVFELLAPIIAEGIYNKLKRAPAKRAYKRALGAAIERYAKGERLVLAQPLLTKKGLLDDQEVADELAQLLRFEGEPNLERMAAKWKSALGDSSSGYNFVDEARLLVGYLEDELRASEVFRPVFEAEDLNQIAISAEQSPALLENIEIQLEGLRDLLDARLGKLLEAFAQSSFGIRDQIRDFSRYIEEKTRGFVGRQWIFDAVQDFVEKNPRGYFFIIGDPGIGKSALAAQMVKQEGYIHHFNIRAEGINKASTFLKNVCAQLIAAYQLPYPVLSPEVTDDAGQLNKLLGEVSNRLSPGERCVIVIDALDEVSSGGTPEGANLLYLPLTLPENVYIIVTMRDDPKMKPRIDCKQKPLHIAHDSSDNLADVRDFVHSAKVRPGIRDYMQAQHIDDEAFITMMVEKSEGNFMYLYYVIPEIADGAYKHRDLATLPTGLQDYYQDHWRRMRGQDEEAWFQYKLSVLVALAVVKEPVSIDLVSDFSRVRERARIRAVLRDWSQFLHNEKVADERGEQTRYRIYHESFQDFIASKEEVEDERVDLIAMHEQISNQFWEDLYGNE